ncbi:hypothetical protein L917_13149 [Phytophthora nicotianae]|uniref:Uncharacterized protein n=1 Tax=Phytophthora nicotianae TaxID=4792 RepID=W2MX34_PHYNI|nr:hypothetical protein L916_13330 [Phytophthora nicotianae]ETL87714.1 hypothetical protein L917_13149 [Phytophthora nicotianae]ETM40947.1 hypothetical protein L914_13239 [Phytophthora nicotianae]
MPTPVRLQVKIGEVTKRSRTDVPVRGPRSSFDSEKDNYEVFCSRIEDNVVESLRSYRKRLLDQTKASTSSQARLLGSEFGSTASRQLCPSYTSAYTNYHKRTEDSGPFEIEVFVLVAKKERRYLEQDVLRQPGSKKRHLLSTAIWSSDQSSK